MSGYPSRAPPPVPRYHPRGGGQNSPGYANDPQHLQPDTGPRSANSLQPPASPGVTGVVGPPRPAKSMFNGPGVGRSQPPISPPNRSPRYKDSSDAHNRFHRGSSNFDQIRMDCLRRGIMFEDPDFPASDTSLYYSRTPPYRFEWKRPMEIAGYSRQKASFFLDGSTRFDVKQGSLGDCWVVAAVACLTSPDHQELFRRIVPADQGFQEGWYAGLFRFNFWHFGKWKEVIVDDRLPTSRGELMFVHSHQKNEFWAALLEKAYAKLYGSYEALKGGNVADALTDFTGGITEGYILRGPNADVPRSIVNILFKSLDRQSLIGCGINSLKGGATETELPNGLVAGHAYSITDLREILLMSANGQVPVTLIRVRNPWGTPVRWNGLWGERSSEWKSIPDQEKERMGLVFRDPGEFWMDFSDFQKNFDTVDICNLTPDSPIDMPRQWHTSEFHGRWQKGFTAGGRPTLRDTHWCCPQYRLRLQNTDEDDDTMCSFLLQLMQKDRRKMKNKAERLVFIGFVIYRYKSGYPLPLKRDYFDLNDRVANCDMFVNSRQIIQRLVLPPGDYVFMPCAYDVNEEADFYLRFFFENKNSAEGTDEPSEKLDIALPQVQADNEQEEQFRRFFYSVSGEDMEVNPYELMKSLNDGLKRDEHFIDTFHKDLSVEACKCFISVLDVDNSGRLGYTEFLYLWSLLRSWKRLFSQYDAESTGTMSSFQLRTALLDAGFKLTTGTVAALVFKYSNVHNQISCEHFLCCLAKLTKLFNIYQKFRKNGHAVFTIEQWLEQSLCT
ncbi:calpain-9-like [Dreissena polymorpha]|uniref:Uncharacterized protein n=1 Tax=Dreissena polymorpha TaxID=45954 RepID=A0A9D4R6Y8_DREPO|nr:calpain-9-like [Dreissena polymorpha]KAH3856513.1 hypothetical protein DPMN_099103 [Dreissena polymorpha]